MTEERKNLHDLATLSELITSWVGSRSGWLMAERLAPLPAMQVARV
jgi:hypothetical protein